MKRKFQVKSFTWVNGILKSENHQFDDIEAAMHFTKYHGCDQSKLVDPSGRVVYQQKNTYVPNDKKTIVKPRNVLVETYA